MTPLLPQDALAPFAEEISGRQKRRERRVEQEAKAAESEAAAAAAAAAAANSRGLSAQELKVSPLDPPRTIQKYDLPMPFTLCIHNCVYSRCLYNVFWKLSEWQNA